MNKNIQIALVGALLTAVFFTGCTAKNTAIETSKTAAANIAVSTKEDTQIKKLISDYFVKMYSEPVANYQENSEKGLIPEKLKTFIAKRTITEGNNNIEIGLNFPRYIGLNGITLISYNTLMKADNMKQPQIESTFIEKKDGTLLYFSKVNLKAECIPDDIFEGNYTLNKTTNTYKKASDVSGLIIDKVLVQTKYDVELVKDGTSYKILRARESTYKQGARNRLFRYNNDFVTRLSYLDLSKTDDNKGYINKKDGAIYDKEKATITSFFDNISNLDNERRTLLSGSWDSSGTNFKKLVDEIGISKNKDKIDIMTIDGYYKSKLPKEALLLQNDMNKVKINMKELRVDLHPAYSEMKKWYIVTFDATVNKTTGIAGSSEDYTFDYLVKLTEKDKTTTIDTIKLNNMSQVVKQVAAETGKKEKTAATKTSK